MTTAQQAAYDKYEKAFINTFNSPRIPKTDLMPIWNVFVTELWDQGFDGMIGRSWHNEFLHYVMFPRIGRNIHWLVANGGENLVMLRHMYKNEIAALVA
jgi:hypothetical protein